MAARFGPALATEHPRGFRAYLTGNCEGLAWAVCRSGWPWAANGYVRLPEGHIARQVDYDRLGFLPVPGGLTYGPDRDGWVGFDTGHPHDRWPRMPSVIRDAFGMLDRAMSAVGFQVVTINWTRAKVARHCRVFAAGFVGHQDAIRHYILREQLLSKQDQN